MALVAAPPGVDLPRITAFLQLPDDVVSSLASLSESFIPSLLERISEKALEFDGLKADKMRLSVEIEQKVRTAEHKTKAMKVQLDGALTEARELRVKVAEAGE